MKGKNSNPNSVRAPILAIVQGKGKKRKGPPKQNLKGKSHAGSSRNGPKENLLLTFLTFLITKKLPKVSIRYQG
mgnify:CR=1 FL=1